MSTTTRIRAVRDERVDGRFPVRWHAADPRDARVAGSDTDAIRINVITTRACMAKASGRSTRHGGGFLGPVSTEEELAAYSRTGWTHTRILERRVPSHKPRGYAYWPVAALSP